MVERAAGSLRGLLCVLLLMLSLSIGGCGEETEPAERRGFADGDDAPPIELTVEVDPLEVALLDEVAVRFSLWLHDGIECDFEPTIPAGFVGEVAEPVSRRPVDAPGEYRTWSLELRAAELGELEIPAYTATGIAASDPPGSGAAGETIDSVSDPVSVTVVGVLAGTLPEGVAADAIEAPGQLFAPRMPWFELGAGGFVALLGVAGLVFWIRRRQVAPRAAAAVEVPAHVEALRALARLRSAPRGTEAEIDSFYVAVSDVLRRYLERRFGLHAPERTTEEFLPELERSGVLDAEQRLHLARFLEQCDLVKFAGVRPGDDVHGQTFDFAEELVHATRADRHLDVPSPPRNEEATA